MVAPPEAMVMPVLDLLCILTLAFERTWASESELDSFDDALTP